MTITARTAGSAARWTRRPATSTCRRRVPCLGKAGSITVHHVRAVHGSATNFSGRQRRFLLYQYRAADAWPLLGLKEGIDEIQRAAAGRRAEPRAAPRAGAGAHAVAAGRAPGLDLREPARQRPALFRDGAASPNRGGVAGRGSQDGRSGTSVSGATGSPFPISAKAGHQLVQDRITRRERTMSTFASPLRSLLVSGLLLAVLGEVSQAADFRPPKTDAAKIANAMTAAPPAVSRNATIAEMGEDGNMKVLRKGSGAWTCVPDDPSSAG